MALSAGSPCYAYFQVSKQKYFITAALYRGSHIHLKQNEPCSDVFLIATCLLASTRETIVKDEVESRSYFPQGAANNNYFINHYYAYYFLDESINC